jgi:hypothetical protein
MKNCLRIKRSAGNLFIFELLIVAKVQQARTHVSRVEISGIIDESTKKERNK